VTFAGVFVDKVADTQVSGYTADDTRYYLPPATARAGQVVRAIGRDLYSDGVRGYPVLA
jgi:hypothetical protein